MVKVTRTGPWLGTLRTALVYKLSKIKRRAKFNFKTRKPRVASPRLAVDGCVAGGHMHRAVLPPGRQDDLGQEPQVSQHPEAGAPAPGLGELPCALSHRGQGASLVALSPWAASILGTVLRPHGPLFGMNGTFGMEGRLHGSVVLAFPAKALGCQLAPPGAGGGMRTRVTCLSCLGHLDRKSVRSHLKCQRWRSVPAFSLGPFSFIW